MLENVEFIASFVEEASGHITNIEAGLLNMDVENPDSESIHDLFRAMHSIKGTAGFFSLSHIVQVSHSMENILGECRSGNLMLSESHIDILLTATDCLKTMISDVMNSEEYDISDVIGQLKTIKAPQQNPEREAEANTAGDHIKKPVPGDMEESNRRIVTEGLRQGKKLYSVRILLNEQTPFNAAAFLKLLESIGTVVSGSIDIRPSDTGAGEDNRFTLDLMVLTVLEESFLAEAAGIAADDISEITLGEPDDNKAELEQPQKKAAVQNPDSGSEEATDKKNAAVHIEDSLRVHVTLLNHLLNLASEMVLGRNQLLRAMELHHKDIPGIDPILQNIDHITTDLQETIMQTRMQPVANVFNRFPRIIRDLSKKLGKEIELALEGVDVELDKTIIEALGDPLTHLVRNAADHGLESAKDRRAAGKSATGQIILKAYHESGYVNIDVMDDGRGVDLETVKRKALEKGLLKPLDSEDYGEQEILQFLFKPGFSTSEKVTDLSGRGVGMDVVKTNIEKLGGSVEIFTQPGKGTTFRLLLPLTLAIIPSLIVEVEEQKFALPQVNLQEIVRIKPGEPSKRIEYIHNAEVLRLRGRLLPIVHLADVLGLRRTYIDPTTGERREERRKTLYDQRRASIEIQDQEPANRRRNYTNILRILVLKIGSRRFGMAIDVIHGSEEILVKTLPKFMKDSRCYSGVTIMGDGKAAMILDPEGIVQKAQLRFIEGTERKNEDNSDQLLESMRERQNLLLFRPSGTELLGLDLSLVSRVEEISPNQIERIGGREYIKYRNSSLRIIRPEDFLPLQKTQEPKKRYYVIIPKLIRKPMGILVTEIIDTVQTVIQLDQETITAKGLFGSFVFNNRIILLLNLYELFEQADPGQYAPPSVKTRQGRILLVEDTPFFMKMETDYLSSAGYSVITAYNGKEALQLLKENEVDMVISDIQMPVMDGLELAKRIRQDKKHAGLPLIALTSLTTDKQVRDGLDAGFNFYEIKLDKSSLLEKVEKALQKGRRV